MNWWQMIVMAIVEGLTEYLPISSTAHLELAAQIMQIPQTEFVKSFVIGIQTGAIAAIISLYAKKVFRNPKWWGRISLAFVPTGILGLVFYKLIKTYLLGNSWIAIVTMGLGGILLLKFEILNFKFLIKSQITIEKLSYKKALFIGLSQSLAMIPGVSRALAAIWGGMAVGLSREAAVEMSFLLAVPTLMAATGLDLLKSGVNFSGREWGLLATGAGISYVAAILSVRWMVDYVKKSDLKIFGWYRITVALLWGAGLIFFR